MKRVVAIGEPVCGACPVYHMTKIASLSWASLISRDTKDTEIATGTEESLLETKTRTVTEWDDGVCRARH